MKEHDVIRRCQEGDMTAFRWIYDRYEQPLLCTALRMLGQQQDAEDAVQVTFLKLHRSIGRFRYDSKFSTYLFRILLNVCFDHLNSRKRMRKETLDANQPYAEPAHDLRMALAHAIDRLPRRQKACFVLFAVEELPQEEIAEILGLSLGGVKSNIYHAKRQLRTFLADEPGKESRDGMLSL